MNRKKEEKKRQNVGGAAVINRRQGASKYRVQPGYGLASLATSLQSHLPRMRVAGLIDLGVQYATSSSA